jgi:two-component system response regulator TctD
MTYPPGQPDIPHDGTGVAAGMNVLLVENDLDLCVSLSRMLSGCGFQVVCCSSGLEGLAFARRRSFDALILDLGLPDIDGLELLQRLRDGNGNGCGKLPVLIVTARGAVGQRVQGLEAGADDYLSKPFDVEELAARLKALVRRSHGVEELRCAMLRIEPSSGVVFRGALPLDISAREFSLLKALMSRPGQAVSKEDLHQAVFGDEVPFHADAIEVLVHRLRKRIQGSGAALITLRGLGYFLVDEATSEGGSTA